MDVAGFLMVPPVGTTSKIPASVTCMLVLLPQRSLGLIDLCNSRFVEYFDSLSALLH